MNAESLRLDPAGDTVVASPCTGICQIGQQAYCIGCGRDLDEITLWSRASNPQRRLICARAAERLLGDPPEPR